MDGTSPTALHDAASARHAAAVSTPPADRAVWRQVGDYRWLVRPGHLDLMDDQPAETWWALDRQPGATCVKKNAVRQVWHLVRPGGDLYAKVFRANHVGARIKRWLFGPACYAEWRVAEYARRHGVPTVQPIACIDSASRWAGARCVLITAAMPDALPLQEAWTRALALPGRRRLDRIDRIMTAVAELIAVAHQNGMRHVDLHAGNVLVDTADDRTPDAAFVDLYDIRAGRPVSDAGVVRNLTQLNQWFRRHATLTQRLRFLHRYLAARRTAAPASSFARELTLTPRQLIDAVTEHAHRHAHFLYGQRDRRVLRTNTYFARVRRPGGWRGHVCLRSKQPTPGATSLPPSFQSEQWRAWLAHPANWLRPEALTAVVKDSHSALVGRAVLPAEPKPIAVVVKHPRARSLARRLAMLLRPSRAMRVWRRGHALLHRNLPTARPLAVLERRRFGLRLDAFVLCEDLVGGRDLDAWLAAELPGRDARQQRRLKDRLIAALAALVRRMHDADVAHRDLKASNVLVQYDPDRDDAPRLSLVDLDGVRIQCHISATDTRRAIARLAVSFDASPLVTRTDRLRFLRRFLVGWGRGAEDWRPVWRDIDTLARPLRERYKRHRDWKLRHYGRA